MGHSTYKNLETHYALRVFDIFVGMGGEKINLNGKMESRQMNNTPIFLLGENSPHVQRFSLNTAPHLTWCQLLFHCMSPHEDLIF